MTSCDNETLDSIRSLGLIKSDTPSIQPLTGGVSSDVWLIEDAGRKFVVKRSVPKLRVKADWFSDPARLRYEALYIQTVAGIVPGAVPRLLTIDPDSPFLAMEYLGEEFCNWKQVMLSGNVQPAYAARAGEILGRIHSATTNDAKVAARFDTMEFFTQLRIDAYLRATAEKQSPEVAAAIRAEADHLSAHQECLVHGDFSPKNMLVSPDRFVVLDCETACFGDPAFDLAFLLNHLFLKALYHSMASPQLVGQLVGSVTTLRIAYTRAHPEAAQAIENRTARLLPMLLLARVDGKSPVEYLSPHLQEKIRLFAPYIIQQPETDLSALIERWFGSLNNPSI